MAGFLASTTSRPKGSVPLAGRGTQQARHALLHSPTPPSNGRRRCAIHRFDPAEWDPVSVTHYFKRALPGENYPHGLAAEVGLLIAGPILHVETQFRCVSIRRRRRRQQHRSSPARGGGGSSSSGSSSSANAGSDHEVWSPDTPVPFDAPSSPSASSSGSDETPPGTEAGSCAGLTLVVSAVRGDVIRPVFKTSRRAQEWVSLSPRMSQEDMRRCYSVQTDALGLEYSEVATRNVVARFFGCGCLVRRGDAVGYFCSELVAASLQGTALEVPGGKPWLVSPHDLYESLSRHPRPI